MNIIIVSICNTFFLHDSLFLIQMSERKKQQVSREKLFQLVKIWQQYNLKVKYRARYAKHGMLFTKPTTMHASF